MNVTFPILREKERVSDEREQERMKGKDRERQMERKKEIDVLT